MDDRKLKKALENIEVPETDDNAKKRALNLAMAEFDDAQKKNEKSSQGTSLFSRLMGNPNKDTRRETMLSNKKMFYGGMATAMTVLLVAGISFQQSKLTVPTRSGGGNAAALKTVDFMVGGNSGTRQTSAEPAKAKEAKKQIAQAQPAPATEAEQAAPVTSGNNFSMIAQNITPQRHSFFKRERADMEADAAIVDFGATGAMPAPAAKMMAESRAIGIVAPYPGDNVMPQPGYHDVGRDKFKNFEENNVHLVSEQPVSTFSVDVDTSSYSFMRSQINNGVLPQKDAVRIEEMINYFDYSYPLPETKEQPFKPTVTVVPSPWKEGDKLVHIGIKGYDIAPAEKPRSNLVFLLDVSGSMNAPDKLPLLKNSMKLLLDTLSPDDTVGIVVYAGAAGTVLEPTKASDKNKILKALDNLSAGGSTAGAEGIRQAYQLAENNFDKEAVNRVILATDGDFNVGITNSEELKDFVERKRDTGIFLSVLGFGQGNYNDAMMQELAQNGNGVAAYIDNLNEARKVLVQEASSTLFTIAKDVKIQVEFNPATVAEYRLIGYETRHLNREDFNNDKVDAGDIGSGHAVTAIYEITPVGAERTVDDSRYAAADAAKTQEHKADTKFGNEYAFLKIRYKLPNGDTSKLITTPITKADEKPLYDITCPPDAQCLVADQKGASNDTRFSIAVAEFGQLLKGSKYSGSMTYDDVIKLAQDSKGKDEFGYRAEFINLVRLAKSAAALQKN